MSLSMSLVDYIRAAFSGLYLETLEPAEALRELTTLCHEQGWSLATWDLEAGLQTASGSVPTATDPLAAIRSLPSLATPDGTTLLALVHFHRFLNSPEIVQALWQQLQLGKTTRTFVVLLAPTVTLPPELERAFVVVTHALPSREQLARIAHELVPELTLTPHEHAAVLDAAAGLTRSEAEGAFALSLIRNETLRPETLWELKAQALSRQSGVTLTRTGETFAQLGGLAALKDFCRRALQPGRSVRPRGALLLSPPGCGKSAFCRALGQEVGRPVLTLDLGALYGSLVGETERNVRRALASVDALAPAILFVDELDKGLAGTSGEGDSGVARRLFGTLLTWLAEHQSDVFFIGTANDIRRLPPEFTRAERLDGVFFLDLPGPNERAAIWTLYRRAYDVPASQPTPPDTDWTGAEIKSCCRLAVLLDVPLAEAARQVVPVARTAAETIDALRTWASGRCLAADHPGLYQRPAPAKPSRRKLTSTSETN